MISKWMVNNDNFGKNILQSIYFPKNVVIDKPGIIINLLSKKYGSKTSKKRTVYYFEDTIVNLQLETFKKLGREKTRELWYKMGKDMGARYMLLAKVKKISSTLMPFVVKYIFSNLGANGMSVCNGVDFNNRKFSLVLEGKDNIIWRKTKDGSIIGGLVSGILSSLCKKNIEAEDTYNEKSDVCKIIANKEIEGKYVPNLKNLLPLENYDKLNFPDKIPLSKNSVSFRDFVKFKKIEILEDGKHTLNNKTIIPTEIGLLELMMANYLRIGEYKLLKKSIIGASEKLCKELLKDKKDVDQKLNFFKQIFCALGWGIPLHKFYGKKIIFDFLCPPVCKYGFQYPALVLNGFLNKIFNENFEIEDITLKNEVPIFTIIYSC
jgi:hypothetical protein